MIVVAGLIHKEGKVLIAQRKTGHPSVIYKWEFPGGKLEEDETEKEAIVREIKEEFEIEIKVNRYITKVVNGKIELKLYDCDYVKGIINNHDHFQYKWVYISELLNYDLLPSDIELAKYLMDKVKR